MVAATVNCTVPLPLDGVADAIAIHGSLLAAVQAQPAPVVTVTGTVPPPPGTEALSGDSE